MRGSRRRPSPTHTAGAASLGGCRPEPALGGGGTPGKRRLAWLPADSRRLLAAPCPRPHLLHSWTSCR